MATITLTISAQDATRLQNAMTVLGYPTIPAMILALIAQAVHGVEQQNFQPTPLGISAQ